MTRYLPFPLLSLGLMVIWLLMNQTLAPAHILLGATLGVIGGRLLHKLQLPPTGFKRPVAAARLAARVFADIARSNVAVARIILLPKTRNASSGFVDISLRMRSPYGLACLACIITAAPGTCWVDYDPNKNLLRIHVLDLIDEQAWKATVTHRYETLLMEIFE